METVSYCPTLPTTVQPAKKTPKAQCRILIEVKKNTWLTANITDITGTTGITGKSLCSWVYHTQIFEQTGFTWQNTMEEAVALLNKHCCMPEVCQWAPWQTTKVLVKCFMDWWNKSLIVWEEYSTIWMKQNGTAYQLQNVIPTVKHERTSWFGLGFLP